ncbi:MAG TPA: mechanosensitive ion channel [Sorangium sp.]|nr:mechanosensitive ion channel [Sorangium sp.]
MGQLLSFIRWSGVFISVFVLIGANLTLRFISGTAERLSARFTQRRLTIQKFDSFARFSVYLSTATLVLVLSFQINEQTLKVVGAALVFALGFAMRDLLAAVVAGVTIMFDRPFQVGDRVNYAGQYGDIILIGLRSVRMRTLDDNIVTIPNNKILTDVSSSGNYGALDMMVVIDFFIGADQDIQLAERLVREAMLTSRYVYLKRPVVVLVKQQVLADMVVVKLRAKGYVLDTRYEKAFETDVSKRVLMAFSRYQVLPPAPFLRARRATMQSTQSTQAA